MLFRGNSMCRSTDTENMAYSNFRYMTLVQKGTTGKRMLDWGQTLKGFFKKFHHRNRSLIFLLVWCITENDDAKQKCQRECWGWWFLWKVSQDDTHSTRLWPQDLALLQVSSRLSWLLNIISIRLFQGYLIKAQKLIKRSPSPTWKGKIPLLDFLWKLLW